MKLIAICWVSKNVHEYIGRENGTSLTVLLLWAPTPCVATQGVIGTRQHSFMKPLLTIWPPARGPCSPCHQEALEGGLCQRGSEVEAQG